MAMRCLFLINGLLLTAALHAQAQPADPFATVAAQQAFVTKTCAGCHNDKLKTGGFTWSKIDLNHPEQSAELSEKVVHILRAGMMPPPGIPRPDRATMDAYVGAVNRTIERRVFPPPTRVPPPPPRLTGTKPHTPFGILRGLNRHVPHPPPADDASHGFDNMSDVLGVSPALMD